MLAKSPPLRIATKAKITQKKLSPRINFNNRRWHTKSNDENSRVHSTKYQKNVITIRNWIKAKRFNEKRLANESPKRLPIFCNNSKFARSSKINRRSSVGFQLIDAQMRKSIIDPIWKGWSVTKRIEPWTMTINWRGRLYWFLVQLKYWRDKRRREVCRDVLRTKKTTCKRDGTTETINCNE